MPTDWASGPVPLAQSGEEQIMDRKTTIRVQPYQRSLFDGDDARPRQQSFIVIDETPEPAPETPCPVHRFRMPPRSEFGTRRPRPNDD